MRSNIKTIHEKGIRIAMFIFIALSIVQSMAFAAKYLARPKVPTGNPSIAGIYNPSIGAWAVDEIPPGWVKVADIKPATIFLDTSVKTINATDVWKIKWKGSNITGLGSVTCLIDTGVNFSHPALQGKNATQFSINCARDEGCVVEPLDNGVHWHGTHVAGIIASAGDLYGVAWNSSIISVRVMNSTGQMMSNWILNAIDWCEANRTTYNIKTISMSIGINNRSFTSDCDSIDTTGVAAKASEAAQNGLIVVASAGNCYNGNTSESCGYTNYNRSIASPACASKVISVGAYDESTGKVAGFSQNSSSLDLVAPGVDINSTYPPSDYSEQSGTSMAAPHVTGVIDLMLQVDPSMTWSRALSILTGTAIDINDPKQGKGLVNALLAVNSMIFHWQILDSEGLQSQSSINKTVWINNTGYVDETANVSMGIFENSFHKKLNLSLSNGTHSGKSLMLRIPAQSSAKVYVFNTTANAAPGRYVGLLRVNSSTSYNESNITIDVPFNATGGLDASVNYTDIYDTMYFDLPYGIKNITVSNTSNAENISLELYGNALIWTGTFPATNQTNSTMLEAKFRNLSSQYTGLFNISLNYSLFIPEFGSHETDANWTIANVSLKFNRHTRNISLFSTGLFNESAKQNVEVKDYEVVYSSNITLPNSTNASWMIYIPKNLSAESDVIIDIKSDDPEPTITFCRFFGDNIPAGDFPKSCNRLGISFGSYENLTISNDDVENHTYAVSIIATFPNDTYLGFMPENWNAMKRINVSGEGNGTDFMLEMIALDNSTGREVSFNVPVYFLPDMMYNGTGGNISVRHYFNKGHNSTLSLRIDNPSIRNLQLLGTPCYENSSFSQLLPKANSSRTLDINGIDVTCSIGNLSHGWVNVSIARNDSFEGTYRGWVMIRSEKAYPFNFINFTIDIEMTTKLAVVFNKTYNSTGGEAFLPLSNASANVSVRYMDGIAVEGLNESNATLEMEGPNGEYASISKFLFNSTAELLNFTLPNITGGSWEVELNVSDANGNRGTGRTNITVSESNIDVSIIAPSSAKSGSSVSARINITNYGEIGENVFLNITGCKKATATVFAPPHSYNDTYSFSFSPSSSCTITVNASNGTFWNGTEARPYKLYFHALSVSTTTTTTTTTIITTTTQPQDASAGGEGQTTTTTTTTTIPAETFDFNASAVGTSIKDNGSITVEINSTRSANFTIKFKSLYFEMQEKNITVNGYASVSITITRGALDIGTYPAEIIVSANGKEKKIVINITVEPSEREISEAKMDIEYLKNKIDELEKEGKNTTSLEEAVDEVEKLLKAGNYSAAITAIRNLKSEVEMISKKASEAKKGGNAAAVIAIFVSFAAIVALAFYAIKTSGGSRSVQNFGESRPKYSFQREKSLKEKIVEFLGRLTKN